MTTKARELVAKLENRLTRDGKYQRDGQCLFEYDWIYLEELINSYALSVAKAALEEAEKVTKNYVEMYATHILHYHDKEGRTTNERVFHEARFDEIVKPIRSIKPETIIEKVDNESREKS